MRFMIYVMHVIQIGQVVFNNYIDDAVLKLKM